MSYLKNISVVVCAIAVILVDANIATAQVNSGDFKKEFLRQFEYSSSRILTLAEEMPEDTYTWSPDGEAMSVARVYMHIARYNYLYPEWALGIESPGDIDLETIEEITNKTEVLEHLQRSIEHLKKIVDELSTSDLEEPTQLYGRTVDGWVVLYQLQTHMSEHVGQSIAYARMNNVTPPWSQ